MEMRIEKAFGDRLRQVRNLRRLSQDELGGRIGVEKSTISKYEKGKRGLSARTVIDLAAALNCSPAWLLFSGEDDAEITVGGRTHEAAAWWNWFAGLEPLPGENRKDFFRAATVDQAYTLSDSIAGDVPTPHMEYLSESLRPWMSQFTVVGDLLKTAGYASMTDLLNAHPERKDWTIGETIAELRNEQSGEESTS